MTTREISEVAGVSTDTVARKAKELYPDKFSRGKRIRFSEREAIAIMGELRKKGFVELPQNAEVTSAECGGGSTLTKRDLEMIAAITANMVSAITASLDGRISKIEARVQERQALLPPPEIKPRDRVNMLVRQYATRKEIPFSDAWKELYRQFYYRTHTNPQACAKHRDMSVLDYIEVEGQMDTLEAVAAGLE